jgi:hypothetical protein
MKTIATLAALCLSVSAAFACPNHDHDDSTPKTADKKETPKQEEAPKPDTAKKSDTKAPDKVADASKKPADKTPAKK